MKKNAFTIVEILAAIVILGIISMIGTVAITRYLEKSNKDVYVVDLKTFVKAARDKYNLGKIAQEPKQNEALVVAVSSLELSGSNEHASPYGKFILDKTYVIITRNNELNTYYIVALDDSGVGMNVVSENDISTDNILEDDSVDEIKSINELKMGETIKINEVSYRYLVDEIRNPSTLSTFLLKVIE